MKSWIHEGEGEYNTFNLKLTAHTTTSTLQELKFLTIWVYTVCKPEIVPHPGVSKNQQEDSSSFSNPSKELY